MSMIKGIRFRATGPAASRPSASSTSTCRLFDRDFSRARRRTATASSVDLIVTDPDLFSEIRAIGDAGGSVFPIAFPGIGPEAK